MLRLPYGVSNFPQIVRGGYHYVDRTPYVVALEQLAEPYLIFLRPRRFGKSLFVSLLQCYYGLEFEANFAELFGTYAIGHAPTPLANRYLVLKLDFSHIDTQSSASAFDGFFKNIRYGVSDFLGTYRSFFDVNDDAYILAGDSPIDLLSRLLDRLKRRQLEKQCDYKVYLLIDEYDHFANELIAFHLDEFKGSVSRNGYVRKFYERIKRATSDGMIERIFITGVSPLTLDSMTSGFNIAKNLSLDIQFHNMMGFTGQDVAAILDGIGIGPDAQSRVIADMHQWYDGYLFNARADNRLYNPDMALYFASELGRIGEYPTELLDVNIASDYGKLREIIRIDDQEAQNLAVLDELITEGQATAQLTRQFSFEKEFTHDDLISLLFYLGIVTIKTTQLSRFVFESPNFVITQLYFSYFQQLVLQRARLRADDLRVYDRVLKLAQENDMGPLVEAVEAILAQLSNRDAMGFDEKYVKAIFAALLYSTQIYTIHSEYETERRYVDLMLIRRPPIEPKYQFAIELKYLKQSEVQRLDAVKAEGLAQMQDYLRHEKLASQHDLRAWLLVFVGTKAQVVQEIGA